LMTAKVADFGMARVLQGDSQEGQTAATVGPIRSMATEALKFKQYSEKSDVWAFGVCCVREDPVYWFG